MAIDQIKINSTAYDIGASASNISFNKNGTSLDATNVQSAIVEIDGDVGAKVDKVNGKGLSTNDFTDADKTKLNSIETGAQTNTITGVKGSIESAYRIGNVSIDKADIGLANVDNTADVNKPISTATQNALNNKVDKVTGKDLSTNDYTNADKTKLAGISAQANRTTVTQVQESGDTSKEIAQIGIDGTNTSIYADDAKKVIESCYEEKTATGNPIAIKTISGSNAKALTVTMNPIQDLHGYSNPWVGGAGKNKFPIETITRVANPSITTNIDGSYTISGSATGYVQSVEEESFTLPADTYTFSVFGEPVTNATVQIRSTDGQTTYAMVLYGNSTTFTLNESTELKIRFTFNECTVNQTIYLQIESGSQSTSYAPYENICPISGRTEASVTRPGKNLFDKSSIISNYAYKNDTGHEYVSVQGISTYFIDIVAGTTLTISGMKNWGTGYINCFVNSNKEYIQTVGTRTSSGGVGNPVTVTAPNGARYLAMACYTGTSDYNLYQDKDTIQVEVGSTATAYESYNGETHTHQYSETIYGGSDDFVNGGLKENYRYVNMGYLNWAKRTYGNKTIFTTTLSDGVATGGATGMGNAITSQYPIVQNGAVVENDKTFAYGAYWTVGANIYVHDSTYDNNTATEFKAAMSGVQLCYELATPTTIETSAEEITLLKGNNVLSTNADDMELKYTELATFDDYKAYVDNQIQINITDVLNASY